MPHDAVSALRPEARLLLAGAQARRADDGEIDEGIAAVEDWDFFLRASEWHHVAPLLYRSLKGRAIPDGIRHALQRENRWVAERNLQLVGALGDLLSAFEDEGITAVPLKGPALATLIYPVFSVRLSADLDFLVRAADLPRAHALLLERGYDSRADSLAEASDSIEARLGLEYWHPDDAVAVELHTGFLHVIHQWDLDPEAVWQRLETVELQGRPVPRLSTEDTLLYLCAHGAKHHYERLKWLCDVAELLQAPVVVDWPALLRRADALRSRRLLLLGLHLAGTLLNAPVPQPLAHEAAANAAVQRMAQQVTHWLFTEPFARPESVASYRFHLQMREDWRDRRAYLAHLATLAVQPTAKDRAFVPLPRVLDPLYYAIRPVRLAVDAMTGRAA